MSTPKETLASRKTELPEGWENYSICKDKIPDTPFLAFKVPLSQEIQGRYNEKMKKYMDSRRKTGMKARPIMFTNWTVKEIEKKYSNMDLIIDLTNTHKVPSMSFYPDIIQILSRFYPDFIQISSRFYPDLIQILSRFYSDSIQIF